MDGGKDLAGLCWTVAAFAVHMTLLVLGTDYRAASERRNQFSSGSTILSDLHESNFVGEHNEKVAVIGIVIDNIECS